MTREGSAISTTLPLFPLGSVLYPGLVLPLHIFEQRYRQLVADLLAEDEPREFGVIAIRRGRETGIDGVSALYETGCTAVVRQVERQEDGRYELMTVGDRRFRLVSLGAADPYFRAEVDFLPDGPGDKAAAAVTVPAVHKAFRGYLDMLGERGVEVSRPDLPDEPVLLSYLVAAAAVVDVPVKQALLEEPDAVRRLAAERALLVRETQLLRSLTAAPASGLRYSPYSQN